RAKYATSRRRLLQSAALLAAPLVLPSSVFGAAAPSNRITIGCIGVGRMGTGDLHDVIGRPQVQILAVCDVDSKRVNNAKGIVESRYAAQSPNGAYQGCATYGDFRDLIARPDIDVVQIVTPDHWHAIPAIAAAKAGKDIFIQKPLTYTLAEGRLLSDTVRAYGRILQVGSQQRSESNFRFACELVRNGRIGQLHTIKIGLPTDPAGPIRHPMPVPPWLNYEMWLGPAPWAEYTEDRVHPLNINDRPGWLRVSDYCLGMITGWGAHHNDIAQWGMGTEYTGPTEIQATAEYPAEGVWDVHGRFRIEYTYASGVKVICADSFQNKAGVLFLGSEGWVYVDRGALDAHPRSLLQSAIKPREIHLYRSIHHKQDFLDCVRSRRQPIAPVEVAHRSCSVCILGHIAMKLGRKLHWDPDHERFTNDDQANRLLSRAQRQPWTV
ncbi:MAG TPA: Gfo/Idh/MocA family oxidoreductase, partial [Tepidisphaeraceae bacterium]|nr:Gfo/Idh/MocA family oxidoreductase [Tepidisphaeraceae bacterium]